MSTDNIAAISNEGYATLDRFGNRELEQAQRSELIAEMPSLAQRGAVYLITGALLVTFALLYFGKVSVVVSAKGRIMPEGDVVNVQSLQSGQVNAVLARRGDRVGTGAPLLKLDVSEPGLDLSELERKYELQKSQLELLQSSHGEAERILQNPAGISTATFVPVAGNTGQLLSALETARARLESAKAALERRPERRKMESDEIQLTLENIAVNERLHREQKALLDAEEQALKTRKDQLNGYRSLAEKKILSPVELCTEEERYRTAESAFAASTQRYDQEEMEISNQKLHLADLRARQLAAQSEAENNVTLAAMNMQQAIAALRQEARNVTAQIDEASATLKTMEEKIKLAQSRVSLTTVTAPVSGTLMELSVNHAGEIVAPGAVVASIAPDNVPLTVVADIQNKDIGFLRPGLPVRVKVDAYPFEQFGTAAGEVAQVLPNAGKDANFMVRVRLLAQRLQTRQAQLNLFPGLTVNAEIMTSSQRLMNLLFSKDASAKQ